MSEFAEIPTGGRPTAAWPRATTAVAGVIGFPVRHSLSPLLHNTAYAAMGLDWSYTAFEVPPASLAQAVAGAAALGLRGLSVTMPHKDGAARLATRRSVQVRRLGAANTLTFDQGAIVAESYDGEGLLDDLRDGGFDPAGRRCGVIGAGGAARAAVLALAEAGAHEIVVVNRTVTAAWRAAALAPTVVRVGRPDDLRRADLVIQATPAAMAGGGAPRDTAIVGQSDQTGRTGPVPSTAPAGEGGEPEVSAVVSGVDPSWFGAGQLVVDLVYDPPLSPFLAEARRQGATVRNGLGMLVYQAARQIRLWTGAQPPLSAMWAAVADLPPAASEGATGPWTWKSTGQR
ncbi:MAG: shikimate dehydrogenase family protein [Acidimicrobiales bacterium]|jgi:shikimate dehydrogenase